MPTHPPETTPNGIVSRGGQMDDIYLCVWAQQHATEEPYVSSEGGTILSLQRRGWGKQPKLL